MPSTRRHRDSWLWSVSTAALLEFFNGIHNENHLQNFPRLGRQPGPSDQFSRTFKRTARVWDYSGAKRSLPVIQHHRQRQKWDNRFRRASSCVKGKNGNTAFFNNINVKPLQPPMSKARITLIQTAFRKMDKTGDGFLTPEDLRGVYNVR